MKMTGGRVQSRQSRVHDGHALVVNSVNGGDDYPSYGGAISVDLWATDVILNNCVCFLAFVINKHVNK